MRKKTAFLLLLPCIIASVVMLGIPHIQSDFAPELFEPGVYFETQSPIENADVDLAQHSDENSEQQQLQEPTNQDETENDSSEYTGDAQQQNELEDVAKSDSQTDGDTQIQTVEPPGAEIYAAPAGEQTQIMPMLLPIPADVAVVTSHAELAAALGSATITTIHIGADIAMTGGISINAAKPSLIIDGTNPYADDPAERDVIHTITEYSSYVTGNTVTVTSNAYMVTVQNLIIAAQNWYGFVYVPDSLNDVYLLYDNVEYTGPQIVYNRHGIVHFKDTDISIVRTISTANEVAEACGMIFEGEVTINMSADTSEEVVHIYYESSAGYNYIEVKPNAVVNVTTNNNSCSFYTSNRAVPFTIGENAVFNYLGNSVFYSGNALSTLEIETGASVDIRVRDLRTRNLIAANDVIIDNGTNVFFGANASSSNQYILTMGTLSVTQPESFVVYNPSVRAPIVGSGTVNFTAQQVNYWNSAVANSAAAQPNYSWRKADGSNLTVSATLSGTGAASNTTSNYDPATDETNIPLNVDDITNTTFNMNPVRVVSMGTLNLSSVSYFAYPTYYFNGTTTPLSTMRAYVDTGSGFVKQGADATANATGSYNLEIPADEEGMQVIVRAQSEYLISQTEITADPVRYTVHFDTGSGSAVNDAIVYANSPVARPATDPTLSGYAFDDWYADTSFTTKWDFTNDLVGSDPTTIYANFNEDLLTVDCVKLLDGSSLQSSSLYFNGEYAVVPPDISGYRATHYTVNDDATQYAFTSPVTIDGATATTIKIHYASTQLVIEVPIQMLFAAFLSDGGDVVSPEYIITNKSELPVRVSLEELQAETSRLDGINLVSTSVSPNELHLNVAGSDGFTAQIINISPNTQLGAAGLLGTLNGTQIDSAAGTMEYGTIEIGGFYTFPSPTIGYKQPYVKFALLFELSD